MKHVEAGVELFHMNLGKIHVFYIIKFIMTIQASFRLWMPLYFAYKLPLYLLLRHKITWQSLAIRVQNVAWNGHHVGML